MLTRFSRNFLLVWFVLLLGLSLAASAQNALYVLGLNSDFQLGFNYINPSTTPQLSKATGTGLSAGVDHSLSIRSGGAVWTWGINSQGQLGDGTGIDRTAPVQVKGISSITAVSAGGWHSLALRSDGTVWAWGRNNEGQVGDSTFTSRSAPVQVSGLTGITAISAGRFHSLALKSDGTVWAWGENGDGQLGNTNNSDQNAPVQMNIISATGIAAGGFHSLVIKNVSGVTSVWATGSNSQGQLGDGTYTYRNSPVQVNSLSGVSKVSAGFDFSMALTTSNTIKAWGINNNGQLGANIGNYNYTTVQNTVGSGYVDIAAGTQIGTARKSDGSVYAWGSNYLGRVGDGTQTDRYQPVLISGITNVSVLAPGDLFTLALKSDGTVYGWGSNDDTRLALVGVAIQQKVPLYNSVSTDFTAISVGRSHSLALKSDGTVWAWGNNTYGQLGDGTTTSRGTPAQVSGLTGVTAISAGEYHSLARLSNGTVWVWGRNNEGQLGIGNTTNQTLPVQTSLTNASAVVAGGLHSLVLLSNGTVQAAGRNAEGQLGNGSNFNQNNSFGAVASLSNVTAIAAGYKFSVALLNDGTLRSWGGNEFGQMGTSSTYGGTYNLVQPNITNVASIAAGYNHTLAVKTDGTPWGWGHNLYGQIGNGFFYTTYPYTVWSPTQIGSLSGAAAAVSGGEYHTLVRMTNGTLYGCGLNNYGQLGDGTTTNRNVPTLAVNPLGVNRLTRVLQVASGNVHSIILRSPATVPVLTSLSQTSASAGSAAFTLTAMGSNFSALDSEILWNGVPLVNISRSATSISATFPASSLASVGSASVTVGTPDDTVTGGYAQSDVLPFTITTPPPANPNLTLSILSVKRNGSTVTVSFSLTNRGGQIANNLSLSNVLLGNLTPTTLHPPDTTIGVNQYAKGAAVFSSVPNTEQQRFFVQGTYTYGSPTKTGSFAILLRIKVP